LEKPRNTAKPIASVDFADMAQVLDLTNIVIHDELGKVLHWTTGCERLYGWSGDEALGTVVHELLKTRYSLPRDEIIKQVRKSGTWQGEIEQHGRTALSSRSQAFGSRGRPKTERSSLSSRSTATSLN
jgi:PAS domain-containing protein